MQDLAIGDHSIKALFNDGEAEAVFHVANPDIPKTGDESDMALWISLMMLSMATACAVIFIGKRRREEEQ